MTPSHTIKLTTISLILVLSFVGVSRAHRHPAYVHDVGTRTSNPDWMSVIKDDTLISELSIPGTHDSMARFGGPIAECQTMTLWDQLFSGVRVLDIRCRHVDNSFNIHHGNVFQRATFNDVLDVVVRFLKEHPRETVLMRVKEEYDPAHNTRTFEETFRDRYWKARPGAFWQRTSDNPRLGEVRGKIVVLQDFARAACGSGETKYGINYACFDIQDQFNLPRQSALYGKWIAVKNQLAKADFVTPETRTTKYMNYLSGSGNQVVVAFPFPYFVASGHGLSPTGADRLWTGHRAIYDWRDRWPDFPRLSGALAAIYYEGTNVLTHDRLCSVYRRRVGALMSDFPGPGLIEKTIRLNDRLRKEEWSVPVSETCDEWEHVPGRGQNARAADIGIGADGSVWIIGARNGRGLAALKWNGSVWEMMYDQPASRIDVDQNGIPWLVDSAGRIWRRKDGRWEQMHGRGQNARATDIGIGADGSVWMIGNRVVPGEDDFGIFRWSGGEWLIVPGGGRQISVDKRGVPWLVNLPGRIWRNTNRRP